MSVPKDTSIVSPNKKVALIGHPADMDLYRSYIKYLKPEKTYKDQLLLKLFEWTPAYTVKTWNDLSINGRTTFDGIMIMVPFLPEMKDIKHKQVMNKIEQALELASKAGCLIASLGAFTSIMLQGQEHIFTEKYGVKLTSGNTFTAAVIIRSIEETARKFNIKLHDQTLAIIGASGDIGSGCLSYFGDKVKKMIVTARGIPVLKEIVKKHEKDIRCDINVSDNNKEAIKDSTIVIFVTSAYTTLFHINDFNPKTIVCDASAPLNVKLDDRLRSDVFLYHGGIASIPFKIDPGFDIGLASPDTFYGCQIESMLIAQNDTLPCSHGRGNITREKIALFLHEFEINPRLSVSFSVGNRLYSEKDIKNYCEYWTHSPFITC